MELLKSDLERCKEAIQKLFLERESIELNDEQLTEITKDIMRISDSHGGCFSTDIVLGFAKGYIDSQLYLQYRDAKAYGFVSLINSAEHDIKNYLENPDTIPSYTSKEHLERILTELDSMAYHKGQGTFQPYYPRVLADRWDYNDALGIKLMQIADIHSELRIRARQKKSNSN